MDFLWSLFHNLIHCGLFHFCCRSLVRKLLFWKIPPHHFVHPTCVEEKKPPFWSYFPPVTSEFKTRNAVSVVVAWGRWNTSFWLVPKELQQYQMRIAEAPIFSVNLLKSWETLKQICLEPMNVLYFGALNPPKEGAFPFKTRVIWVPGGYWILKYPVMASVARVFYCPK